MDFLTEMLNLIMKVFTTYVPGLCKAVLDGFTGLFWIPGVGETGGTVSILGAFGFGIIGIALVGSIVKFVMAFIPHKMKKSM